MIQPSIISIIIFFIAFTLSFILLYYIKPEFVMKIQNTQKLENRKINITIIILTSILFACLAGIVILIFSSHFPNKSIWHENYNPHKTNSAQNNILLKYY